MFKTALTDLRKYKNLLLLVAIFLLVLGVFTFVFYNNSTKTQDKKTSESKEQKIGPNGPLFGVSGTIKSIESPESLSYLNTQNPKDSPDKPKLIELKTDIDSSPLKLVVYRGVVIVKGSLEPTSSPTYPGVYASYQDLKVGQKIYVYSRIDLRGKKELKIEEIEAIEIKE